MTFYDTFISLFGEYDPIIVESNGVLTECTNWGYVGAVAFFLLFMYCCFRLGGAFVGRKSK